MAWQKEQKHEKNRSSVKRRGKPNRLEWLRSESECHIPTCAQTIHFHFEYPIITNGNIT